MEHPTVGQSAVEIVPGRALDASVGVASGLFTWVEVEPRKRGNSSGGLRPQKILAPVSKALAKELFGITTFKTPPKDALPAHDWDFYVDHFSTSDAAAIRLIYHLSRKKIATSVDWGSSRVGRPVPVEVTMFRSRGKTRKEPCGYGAGSFPYAVSLAALVSLVGSENVARELGKYPYPGTLLGLIGPDESDSTQEFKDSSSLKMKRAKKTECEDWRDWSSYA